MLGRSKNIFFIAVAKGRFQIMAYSDPKAYVLVFERSKNKFFITVTEARFENRVGLGPKFVFHYLGTQRTCCSLTKGRLWSAGVYWLHLRVGVLKEYVPLPETIPRYSGNNPIQPSQCLDY